MRCMVGPCADTLLAGGRLNDEVFIDGRSESLLLSNHGC